jgi:hypothetical protein
MVEHFSKWRSHISSACLLTIYCIEGLIQKQACGPAA